MEQRQYLCIDQKSYYATVECVARGLDPMATDLVVADPERSENTICLAVSTHLKKRGIKNRCRIKEIPPNISNVSNKTQELTRGSRVGQLVITPVVIADFVTDRGAERGTGNFGSTGK